MEFLSILKRHLTQLIMQAIILQAKSLWNQGYYIRLVLFYLKGRSQVTQIGEHSLSKETKSLYSLSGICIGTFIFDDHQ